VQETIKNYQMSDLLM